MSDASPHQHDGADGDDEDGERVVMSNSQRAYLSSNNSKKQLFLLCFGLTEGGTPVFDLDVEPWNSIKKRDIKPSRIEFGEEILRRSRLMSNVATDRVVHHQHKPANWSLPKCIEWLQQNPVSDQEDITFLKYEAQRVKEIILNARKKDRTMKHVKLVGSGEVIFHTCA
jgi:hypothetical protein